MKTYIKLLVIVVLTMVVAALSAQQTNSNIKFRKPTKASVTNSYYAPKLDRGYSYEVVTIDANNGRQNQRVAISHNTGANYYRYYGTNSAMNNNVVYNAPIRINQVGTGSGVSAPFADDVVAISNQMRVGREDLPDDPSVPLGDGVLLLVLFAIVWVGYRFIWMKKN